MTKKEFLDELEKRLNGLPRSEVRERINFYDEMIQDMVEEGKSEQEAVSSFGTIDDVVLSIAGKTKMTSLVKERIKPKGKIGTVGILAIILGFPLWFPLLITFFVLMFVAYILLWVLVVVTYSVELAFISSSVACFSMYYSNLINTNNNYGYIGAGICLIGVSLLFLPVCIAATKANIKLTEKIFLGIKNKLIGGKNA